MNLAHPLLLTILTLFTVPAPNAPALTNSVPLVRPNVQLVAELQSAANLIRSTTPTLDDSDLRPILDAIGEAQIVGLGEGSHGTSEFFSFKQRLFQSLVVRSGFTVLVMEGDWAEWVAINQYLQTGGVTAEAALKAQDFAIYKTQEMRRFLEWMREYNITHGRRLGVEGMDFQEPEKTLSIIKQYAAHYLQPALSDISGVFARCSGSTVANGGLRLTDLTLARCNAELKLTQSKLIESSCATTQQCNDRTIALQAIDVFQHGERMLQRNWASDRDAMMATNVQWLASTVFPRQKVVISAHDGHVSKNYGHWATMGNLLAQSVGEAYYSLGMTFMSGSVRAHPVAGQNAFVPVNFPDYSLSTVASLFRTVQGPFFLNIHSVPGESALGKWLDQPQTMWMPGGVVSPAHVPIFALATLTLRRAFDGLVFVPISHATVSL